MGRPKEDPEDRKARLRERRLTEIDRTQNAEKTAAGLTSDLRAVYGLRNMFNMFTGKAKP
jgi:hypothetical protein